MARTKIVVIAAALGHRKKPFHVNVAGRTTSREVVDKVLEKLQCGDPPLRYQLWAVTEERGQLAYYWAPYKSSQCMYQLTP